MANHQVVAIPEDLSSLHLLILEDSEQDFRLAVRALESASLKIEAVHAVTKEQFENLWSENVFRDSFRLQPQRLEWNGSSRLFETAGN